MDGMAFCPFWNRNVELRNARILHSGHSHSRIVNRKMRPKCSSFVTRPSQKGHGSIPDLTSRTACMFTKS